jgi:hypothetical protein
MVATELITGMGELVNYIRELEEENKKQQERAETFRVRLCNRSEELVKALSPWKKEHQDHKRILEAIGELKEENKELKEQLAIKEAEQEEEANLICSLKEENKKLQQYYDKWSIILSEIDGDDFCDLLKDCGWEENDEGELVRSEEPAGAEPESAGTKVKLTQKEILHKRAELRVKLEEIDRIDLLKKKEVKQYFLETENPTIDGCLEFLLKLFPEKKIYEEIYRYDCYSD